MSGAWTSLQLAKKIDVSAGRSRGPKFLSAPVPAEDAIYVSEAERESLRVDRRTLEVGWRVCLPSDLEVRFPIDDELMAVGSLESGLVGAMRAQDGDVVWRRRAFGGGAQRWRDWLVVKRPADQGGGLWLIMPRGGEDFEAVPGVPQDIDTRRVIGDLLVYCLAEGGSVSAYHLADRRIEWQRKLLDEICASYGAHEGGIGFTPGGADRFILAWGQSLLACSLADGRVLWRSTVPVPYYSPNVHEGRVYVLLYDRFVAIDEATGEIVYDVQHPELKGLVYMKTGTIYRNTIAFPSESGHLPVFDLRDGSLVWLYKHGAVLWRTAEADGRLLVTTGDGKLLVFEDRP